MFSCISKNLIKLNIQTNYNSLRYLHASSSLDAARKGTREKARKKKVKVEVKKIGFIPHNQRENNKLGAPKINKHIDDSWKAVSTDNVWVGRYYRWRVYTIEEAIQCHRETHHPTMYNIPDAQLHVEIELNMQGEKVTRFLDNFQRMAMIPHKYDHGEERKIIVFAKGQEFLNEAQQAGASLVGSSELIKEVQNGKLALSDFQYYIAHPNILPELVSLRGLMKKKFPNPKGGTLGPNVGELVKRFCYGIEYNAVKDETQQDFGLIKTCIGTLTMDIQHLKENLISLLEDVNSVRPKRDGKFITRVLIKSPPSSEQLKINPFEFIPENNVKNIKSSKQETTDDVDGREEDELDELKQANAKN